MRAGKLDRIIVLQSVSRVINDAGTPIDTWADQVTVRAELISNAVDLSNADSGKTTIAKLGFRTRFIEGVTTDHRVTYEGTPYRIISLTEIPRRRGLEITVERLGL